MRAFVSALRDALPAVWAGLELADRFRRRLGFGIVVLLKNLTTSRTNRVRFRNVRAAFAANIAVRLFGIELFLGHDSPLCSLVLPNAPALLRATLKA